MKIFFYVVIKNISVFLFYFIIIRFDLTGETFSKSMQSGFPGASKMTLIGMIGASFYMNFVPIILETIFQLLIKKSISDLLANSKKELFLKGIFLHVPLILFWLLIVNTNNTIASSIGMLCSFIVAGCSFQYLFKKTITPK
jgi:hypothetical protein